MCAKSFRKKINRLELILITSFYYNNLKELQSDYFFLLNYITAKIPSIDKSDKSVKLATLKQYFFFVHCSMTPPIVFLSDRRGFA